MELHLDLEATAGTAKSRTSPSPSRDTPPLPSSDAHRTPRPHSNSLSCRIRDSIHRTSSQIKDACETRILGMAQKHGLIPHEGSPGIAFHVPALPSGHSRESVAMVLTKAVESMADQPPYLPRYTQHTTSFPSDLLDYELEYLPSPGLEPTTPSPEPRNFDCVYELPALQEVDNTDNTRLRAGSPPARCGVSIDMNSLPTPPASRQSTPTPRIDSLNFPRIPGRDVSFPYQPCLQTPHQRSQPVPGSYTPYPPPRSKSDEEFALPSTTPRTMQPRPNTSTANSVYPRGHSNIPNAAIRRDFPGPLVASHGMSTFTPHPNLLTAGLRPLPSSTTHPRRAWNALVPDAAQEVDLHVARSSLRKARDDSSRSLARKPGARNLRADAAREMTGHDSNITPTLDQAYMPPVRNIADAGHRYAKPLPPLPDGASVVSETQTTVSRRRLRPTGVYGASALVQETREKASTGNELCPLGSGESSRALLPPPTSTRPRDDLPPELPAIPHMSDNSILKAMREEHVPLMEDVSPSSSTTMTSLSQDDSHSRDKENIPPDSETAVSLTKEQSDLPYLSYSRSIVRRGTLQQLGGRVVQIRKHFEDPTTSSRPNMQKHSGSISTPPAHRQSSSTQHHSTGTHVTVARASSTLLPNPPKIYTAPTQRATPSERPSQSPPDPFPLYTTIHPNQAQRIRDDPTAFRATVSENIRRRLLAASDEAERSTTTRRAADRDSQGESSRTVHAAREAEFEWQWKRFADQDWEDKERRRRDPGS